MLRRNCDRSPLSTRRRAAVLVETALTLPVFLLFLAAIMEFGHFYLVQHVVDGAARRGVHYGSLEDATNASVEAKVNAILSSAFTASEATVFIKDAGVFDTATVNPTTLNYSGLPSMNLSTADTGDYFLVQIEVPYDNVALLPPLWLQSKTIRSRALMRHE